MDFIRAAVFIPLMLAFGAVFNAGYIALSVLFGPGTFAEMIAYYSENFSRILEGLGL